jgi:hypothetical protein
MHSTFHREHSMGHHIFNTFQSFRCASVLTLYTAIVVLNEGRHISYSFGRVYIETVLNKGHQHILLLLMCLLYTAIAINNLAKKIAINKGHHTYPSVKHCSI